MFSDKLRNLRREKAMSQEDVAVHLGIQRTSYAKYENNLSMPPPDKLSMLADLFNVSVDYLLGRTNVRQFELPENVQALEMAQEIDKLSEEQQKQLADYLEFLKSREK